MVGSMARTTSRAALFLGLTLATSPFSAAPGAADAGAVPAPPDPQLREFAVPSAEWLVQKKEARRAIRQRVRTEAEVGKELLVWEKAHPQPGGSVANVADAIDHIRTVAGVDHVGIGADFFDDGSISMVEGLQDVTRYPFLFAELLRRGWSDADLVKLAGQNHLRAMREMERAAAQLQRSTSPATTEGPRAP